MQIWIMRKSSVMDIILSLKFVHYKVMEDSGGNDSDNFLR